MKVRTILIIDNERQTREAIGQSIRDFGYIAETSSAGEADSKYNMRLFDGFVANYTSTTYSPAYEGARNSFNRFMEARVKERMPFLVYGTPNSGPCDLVRNDEIGAYHTSGLTEPALIADLINDIVMKSMEGKIYAGLEAAR